MLLDYVIGGYLHGRHRVFGSRNYQAAIAAMRLELAKVEER
jgi:hypothetical protein